MQLFRRLAESLYIEPWAMDHRALPTTNYLYSFLTPHLVKIGVLLRIRFALAFCFLLMFFQLKRLWNARNKRKFLISDVFGFLYRILDLSFIIEFEMLPIIHRRQRMPRTFIPQYAEILSLLGATIWLWSMQRSSTHRRLEYSESN